MWRMVIFLHHTITALFLTQELVVAEGVMYSAEGDHTTRNGEELTWPSAFWALVSMAVCAATEPSGSILGTPPEWGTALKCSPVVCLMNAAEILLSIRARRSESGWWRLTVRPPKYSQRYWRKTPPPDSIGAARLENNTTFRLLSFAVGPLLQGIKLFACSGILFTQLLTTCYLASFLCDELALNIIWFSAAEDGDAAPLSLAASVLNILSLPSRQEEHDANESSTVDMSRLYFSTLLAIYPSGIFIGWLASSLIFIPLPLDPNVIHWVKIIFSYMILPLYPLYTLTKNLYRHGLSWRIADITVQAFGFWGWGFTILYYLLEPNQDLLVQTRPQSLFHLYGDLLRISWLVQGSQWVMSLLHEAAKRYTDLWIVSNVGNLPDNKPVPGRIWALFPAVFVSLHFLTAIILYIAVLDPSSTLKPSWTNILG